MKTIRLAPIAIAVLSAFAIASPLQSNAQQTATTTAPTNAATSAIMSATDNTANTANVVITSPQLVSELHGVIQVLGTASVTGMRSFFLETRPLNPDASVPTGETGWVPATLPASTAVQNGVLASWDTTLIPDGLYELRLTVTRDNALSSYFVVTPLRVNNAAFMSGTAVPTQSAGASSGVATVTAQLSANVRSGDNVYFGIVGYLTRGSSASVLGVSSGSGWYYIQLSDGTKGWIAPNVILKSGDFSTVPVVTPPPSLPIITPTATAGLVVNGIALAPAAPVCGQSFNISINVNNPGTTASASDKVYVEDASQASTTGTTSATAAIPAINPGGNFVVVVPLTISTNYNTVHQIRATVDGSQITTTYTLAQGSCNLASATPSSAATAVPPTTAPTSVPPTVIPVSPTVAPTVPPTITAIGTATH